MDHAVRAAGEHDVGVAAADDLGRFADGLAAGGAGGEAVDVRALGVEHRRQVAGRHVRLLFQFDHRVQRFQACLDERGQVELSPCRALRHHVREADEILLAFAAAQVDAEARGIDCASSTPESSTACLAAPTANCVWRPRYFQRSGSSPASAMSQFLHFGRDLGGKVAGVEERGVADARIAAQQRLPHFVDRVPQRRDAAQAGDHNTSFHFTLP